MAEGHRTPHLAAVIVGNDGASQTYVANKEKSSHEVGYTSSVYRYSEKTTEKELLESIDFLNNDPEIDGFIVQLPLPKHINEQHIIDAISPDKDVDGFTAINVGRMVLGEDAFIPATPMGICTLLKRYGIETTGKNCGDWPQQHRGHTRSQSAFAQRIRLHGNPVPQPHPELGRNRP